MCEAVRSSYRLSATGSRDERETRGLEVREVEVDGRGVRYRVTGTGRPLVLVHGLAGSWRWWSPMFEQLGTQREVNVVDLPRPQGVVQAADLSSWLGLWLDAAGLERVDVAGHSLGGLVAAELAACRQERIRRLVLVAPAGIPCGRSLPRRALGLVDALYDVHAWLPMVAADAIRTGPITLIRGIAFCSSRDLRRDLSTVRAPTLLAWGEHDRLVPFPIAREWQRMLPTARLAQLSCGHVPMLEAPQELAARMLSFLDEELGDDPGNHIGPRVMDGVRLAGNTDEPSSR
jgi:pimeloyl-ACP methyl ester carboxylesterase